MQTFMGLQGISLTQAAGIFQFAHNLTGWIELIAMVIALLAAFFPNKKFLKTLWPLVLFAMTIFFFIYLTFAFGSKNAIRFMAITWRSNELMEHFAVFSSLFIASLALSLHRLGILKSQYWPFMLSVSLIVSGIVFLFHPQAQLQDAGKVYSLAIHHLFGLGFLVTGILYTIDRFIKNKTRVLQFLWIFTWMITASLLIMYRINPASFHNFHAMQFIQLSPIAMFGFAVDIALLAFLIVGLCFDCKKKSNID